jgi:UDP-glucose 4-epimerase
MYVIDNLSSDKNKIRSNKIKYLNIDISLKYFLIIFQIDINFVIHLAAQSSAPKSYKNCYRDSFISMNNVVIFMKMIEFSLFNNINCKKY